MADFILCGMGLTEAQLLEARDQAFASVISGATQSGVNLTMGAGVGRSQTWSALATANPMYALMEIKAALWKLNGTKYADCQPEPSTTYAKLNFNF